MHTISVLVSDDFSVMGMAALAAFEMANTVAGTAAYRIRLMSAAGGPVRTSIGAPIVTEPLDGPLPDTVLALGAAPPGPVPSPLVAYLRRAAEAGRRVAGACTGAFALAEAGLLDGRRATTHWAQARELQRRFPDTRVEDDRIFVVDGGVWTSAGMSAGIDLALALIEADHGTDLARRVARGLVVYHRRPGGQSQFSALLQMEPLSDRIRKALAYAREHIRSELSVGALAEVACLSPRQFSRLFRAETGQSPAKAIERIRLEAARLLMEEGRHSMDVVAREVGFADRTHMRRAFQRAFGQSPQTLVKALQRGRAWFADPA